MPPKPKKSVELPLNPDGVKVREVPMRYGPGYDLSIVRPKKKKVNKNLENVIPTGIDDGKGAQKLLDSYVEEVCTYQPRKDHATINFNILSDDFRNKPFLKQITHVQMRTIPLLSQVARQDALHPHNSTKKRKHYMEYAKRLMKNDTHLIRARLSSEFIDDTIIKILEPGLQKNTILQHLALHKNAISDAGIEMLYLALRWHPTLHTLWLGANHYTDIGARHLSLLILRNKKIKELNVSNRWPSEIWQKNEYDLHPHITYIGAQYLAKSLMRGSGLTSLSLSDQRVRDDGAIYLFEAIHHCNLRALNLRGNELTDRCCVEFRSALECNSLLEHVILSHNRIGNEGAINIAYGLARNTSMRCLDVGYNAIAAVGLDALHLCLKYNNTITALITVRNADQDSRAEDLVAGRSTVFAFGGALAGAAATKAVGAAPRITSLDSVSTTSSRNSQASASPGKPKLRRQSTGGAGAGKQILSLDLTVPPGVEVMGKSVLSRSFRAVHIDSHEASRSNSFRSNSFRALSQKFDTESDGGHSTDRSGDSPPRSPAGRRLSKRASTPPAPMLGGSSSRSGRRPTANTGAGAGTGAGSPSPLGRSKSVTMLVDADKKGDRTTTTATASTTTAAADGAAAADDQGNKGNEDHDKPAPKLGRQSSSKKFFSFRKNMESEEVKELPDLIRTAPPALRDVGRPVRSRDVGKTMSIPNIKNMGVRPIRSAISPQKDSAQHLMYLRIATPFDPPDERPYPILNVMKDHEAEVKRVKALRQHPQYQYDKAFKLHNTPKVIKHQAALPKVPDYFWSDWHKKIRLQYMDGIDNAPGVVSTRLEPLPRASSSGALDSVSTSQRLQRMNTANSITITNTGAGAAAGMKGMAPSGEDQDGSSVDTLSGAHADSAAVATVGEGGVQGGVPADALNDPNSAYYIYSNDPNQSYRRHLTFKNNGITPGKILAARRKENAIKRAEKLAADAAAAAMEGKSSKSKKF